MVTPERNHTDGPLLSRNEYMARSKSPVGVVSFFLSKIDPVTHLERLRGCEAARLPVERVVRERNILLDAAIPQDDQLCRGELR